MKNQGKDAGKLQVTTPSDREIAMTRVFDVPRDLVFDAWTKPELLTRWLGVRGGWTFAICQVDLRVGGSYRFVWRGPSGVEMGMGGVYREVVRPERLVATEKFDQSWYEGEALDTTTFVERDGRTTATTTVRYASREVRDEVLKSPMERGVAESYDNLDEVLASTTVQGGR
ncbi:MAG: SRPBCC family protein [Gemmatimonadales bacterium]